MRIGANYLKNNHCEFTVWAPNLKQIEVKILGDSERVIPLEQDELGYWQITATEIPPGTLYQYQLNGGEKTRPDPVSHSQPLDVHGPSQVIDHTAFQWTDHNWQNLSLEELIIYELHVGTFSTEGTFTGIIPHLGELKALGINCLEIMPVAQFPGSRNWGYDGVYPFAVQHSYGGVEGFKQLIDACHQQGIAVILDVVYNHLGPEGNYTQDFAPYFTDRYNTPWGKALNFDDAYSYGVRNFFIANVLYWFKEYHLDGLRLDAIHAIYDFGAKHILAEMQERVTEFTKETGKPVYLIAESDLNDVRIINPTSQGGYGLAGQWCDDVHHCIHTLLTGENQGYYQDYGKCADLAKAFTESFTYTWDYSPYRQRYHGNKVGDRPFSQFLIYSQNHDQVGNRMLGDRLSNLISFDGLKLAAALTLLGPGIPMLFMGEEYGETAPFYYFISHGDPDLVKAVQEGRKREFASFKWLGEPPDPASVETLQRSRLNWELRETGNHAILRKFYQKLLELRKNLTPLNNYARDSVKVEYDEQERWFYVTRNQDEESVLILLNFNQQGVKIPQLPPGNWQKQLDSSIQTYLGSGSTLPDSINNLEVNITGLTVAVYSKHK